jgi:hypothetical protein
MLYTRKRFSVPAAPPNVTQEEWDAIFSKKDEKKDKAPKGKKKEETVK